jgi:hypothetical protein
MEKFGENTDEMAYKLNFILTNLMFNTFAKRKHK